MNNFILHHYPLSPYAEKIRSIQRYLGMEYLSLRHSEVPPRKYLQILVGNYKRIPVAQVGADLFCDSELISNELARQYNFPNLDFLEQQEEVQDFIEHVEGKIFFACVMLGATPAMRKKAMRQINWFTLIRLVIDRLLMARSATTESMIKSRQAMGIIREHLKDIEERLDHDFLFGDNPSLADFAAYPGLWFMKDIGESPIFDDYPQVSEWMKRIKALGKPNLEAGEITGEHALHEARQAQPRINSPVGASMADSLNQKVAIGPSDYRLEKTVGILRFEDQERWVIERQHAKVGKVHVHFPKNNYQLEIVNS